MRSSSTRRVARRTPKSRRAPLADRARLAEANLNPETGLGTDYLNRFNEAVMLLELIHDDPSCAGELSVWQPATYVEHFRTSGFKHRDFAIAAYGAAPQEARRRLEEIATTMTTIVRSARDALAVPDLGATIAVSLAEEALARLRPLLSEASAVIHGVVPVKDTPAAGAQDEIDAVLANSGSE